MFNPTSFILHIVKWLKCCIVYAKKMSLVVQGSFGNVHLCVCVSVCLSVPAKRAVTFDYSLARNFQQPPKIIASIFLVGESDPRAISSQSFEVRGWCHTFLELRYQGKKMLGAEF